MWLLIHAGIAVNVSERGLRCELYDVIWGRWVNSLRPSDTIWRQKSGSTLAQVMACCLTAPSHYLNQCSLIITVKSNDIHIRVISQEMPQPSITKIYLKITCLKFHSNFPGANEFMHHLMKSLGWVVLNMTQLHSARHEPLVRLNNKIWWQCLVPTSTKWIWLYKEIIFMNNDI